MTKTMMLALLAISGCVTDDLADDELGEVSQKVNGIGLVGAVCTQATCQIPLGSTTNRTCFLSGISGNLQTTNPNHVAGASIWDNQAGQYFLAITNPALQTIGASAVCVGGATNRFTSPNWNYGSPSVPLGNAPNRRCFLSRIMNQHGMQQWSTDYVSIWKDTSGGLWLGGSAHAGAWTSATATCVDIPNVVSSFFWAQGASGSTSDNLAPNTGSTACGLTYAGGNFTTNNGADGVILDANARNWFWTVSNWKVGGAQCVK